MLSAGEIPTQRTTLASGDAGTDQTVAAMRACAMGNYGAKSPKIREFAIDIINKANVANKDYRGMTVAIHNWVRDNIRYVNDPVGQETLCHPEYTLQIGAGDCDDLSTLEAALLGSMGIDTQFVVVGLQSGGGFSHVYLQADVKTPQGVETMPLDPIMRQYPAGWQVPNAKRKKIYAHNSLGGTMSGLGDLFSEPIGSPNRTYVGNPANLRSFFRPGPNTIDSSDNYVSQAANDNGWNDPQILPTQAFPMQAGAQALEARPGWAPIGKPPNGFLNGLEADFGVMRPSRPTSMPAHANVATVRAKRQGVDNLLSGDGVSVVTYAPVRSSRGAGPQLISLRFGEPAMSQRPPSYPANVSGLGDDAADAVAAQTAVPAAVVAAPAALAPTLLKSAAVGAVLYFLFFRK